MKNPIALRIFILLDLVLALLLILPPLFKVSASEIIFQDNFEDGKANDWNVTSNSCTFNGIPAEWKVVENKLGIKIDGGTCYSEITPNDNLWNTTKSDYNVEFDMTLVSGTDHHFAFRYANVNDWYNFHIQSPNKIIFQRMNNPSGGNIIYDDFSNGQTIHFKLTINRDHLQVYIGQNPQKLIYDNPQMGNYYRTGKIALQGTAGSDPSSETYFDNIIVTSIDETIPPFDLKVPLIKQISDPWQSQIYDSAIKWSSSPTIRSWGCALTSATMILNYYGINKLPNNTPLDPGTLNTWLKNQKDGYIGNGFINWLSLSRLSKLAKNINKITNFDALEYSREGFADKEKLRDNINNNIPNILEVPGHFVVGKGINGNTFNINDPFYSKFSLAEYGNTFNSMGTYTPSNTDLSYIMLTVNPEINLELKDESGKVVGTNFVQEPITSDSNLNQSNQKIRIFYLKNPISQKYKLNIITSKSITYLLRFYFYDINGNVSTSEQNGIIDTTKTDLYEIQFNKENAEQSKNFRIVTFQDLINDINQFKIQKLIIPWTANNLITFARNAEKDYQKGHKNIAILKLNLLEEMTKSFRRPPLIKSEAYNILISDIEYLKKHLQIN